MTCRPPAPGWLAQSRQAPPPARCSGSAKSGVSRPCGPVRCANHGGAPVLRPCSSGGLRSSVQRQQTPLVARDQFRIAGAAAYLIVAQRSPIAGGGKLVQLVEALLVVRFRRRGHDRRPLGEPPGGNRLGIYGISRPRRVLRRRRFSTPGLLSDVRIALRVVSPNIGLPEHAGAAVGIFGAPKIRIEAAYNRSLTPRFALAHHHAGAVWPLVLRWLAQAGAASVATGAGCDAASASDAG